MKKDRSQCPIFWLLSAQAQAALMEAHYDADGTYLNIPLGLEATNDWDTSVSENIEELDEIAKIMREAPKHQRRVD